MAQASKNGEKTLMSQSWPDHKSLFNYLSEDWDLDPDVEYRILPHCSDYRVGDDGSLWSKKRGFWKRMSPSEDEGYVHVTLTIDGVMINARIHRLVLETFVGPCPEGMECCHANDNRNDNRLVNLAWKTPKENGEDCVRNGNSTKGEKAEGSVLLAYQIPIIRERYDKGDITLQELADEYNVCIVTIWQVIHYVTWSDK